MKTITIRMSDAEAAMLEVVKNNSKNIRSIDELIVSWIIQSFRQICK